MLSTIYMHIAEGSLLVGVIFTLFVTPRELYKGVMQLSAYIEERIYERKHNFLGYIPIYNLIRSEHEYDGGKITLIGTIAVFVIIVARVIVWSVFSTNLIAQAATIVLMLIGLAIVYFMNGFLVFRILTHCSYLSLGFRILYSLFYPIGQFYIGTWLLNTYKVMTRRELRSNEA